MLARLALKDLSADPYRSWTVIACSILVASLAIATTLVVSGATESLRLTGERLGADVLVVPRGTDPKVESALLMGQPTNAWMPARTVERVAAVPGVEAASPQVYLTTLSGASCCSASEMFVVAFDPASDFTVRPWLGEGDDAPGAGEVLGGSLVAIPPGEDAIRLYGTSVRLSGTLEPTGSGLDKSVFLTLSTARSIARASVTQAEKPLVIPPDAVSSILVKVEEETDPQDVSLQILKRVPGVSVVPAPKMFAGFRERISTLLSALILVLAVTAGLSVLLLAAVFSLVSRERRRHVGVLRALGATRRQVAATFVTQSAILSATGGVVGVAAGAYAIYLFHDYIVARLGVPFLLPSLPRLLLLSAGGLAAAVALAVLASVVPAWRAAAAETAGAMRE